MIKSLFDGRADRRRRADLKTRGVNIETIPFERPLPETSALIGFSFYLIEYLNPVSYLGFVFHLEYLPTHFGERYAKGLLSAGIPSAAMTFIGEHLEADVGHNRLMAEYVENLLVTERDNPLTHAITTIRRDLMKNRKNWFIAITVVIVMTITFSLTIGRKSAHAQFGPPRGQGCCDTLSARGQGIATAADTFVVDAEFNLSGEQFGGIFGAQSLQIKSTARLLTQNPPTASGTINAITSHVFEVKGQSNENGICEPGEDCLVTLDRAALIPTTTPGLMDLRSVLAISDGQGRFAKACGKIDGTKADGQINFAATPPTVRWSFNGGHLCQCP